MKKASGSCCHNLSITASFNIMTKIAIPTTGETYSSLVGWENTRFFKDHKLPG